MTAVENKISINGNRYRTNACITKAEEEIRSTLRALSRDDVFDVINENSTSWRRHGLESNCSIVGSRRSIEGKREFERNRVSLHENFVSLDERTFVNKRSIGRVSHVRESLRRRNLSVPRLISSNFRMENSSSSSSTCSTLVSDGEQQTEKKKPKKLRNSTTLQETTSSNSLSGAVGRFQSVRNLPSTTSTSLYCSASAYELDLTNSDSVMRWTSQILAELDSIADCPLEISDDEIGRKKKQREPFVIPAEAERTLAEACTELRELRIRGKASRSSVDDGTLENNKTRLLERQEPQKQVLRTSTVEASTSREISCKPTSTVGKLFRDSTKEFASTDSNRTNICLFPTATQNLGASTATEMSEERVRGGSVELDGRQRRSSDACVNCDGVADNKMERSKGLNNSSRSVQGRNRRSTTAANRRTSLSKDQSSADGRPYNRDHYNSSRHYYPVRSTKSPVGKSVRGVVESLIKQAETHLGVASNVVYSAEFDAAFANGGNMEPNWTLSGLEGGSQQMDSTNKPMARSQSNRGEYVELNDACTQTTPISLSRSSSFTWISECGQLDQRNRESFGGKKETKFAADESPTDTSGGSGLDDEDARSLTPMTERVDGCAFDGVDHGSALDKSLSLSGISHSSSSSTDLCANGGGAMNWSREKTSTEKTTMEKERTVTNAKAREVGNESREFWSNGDGGGPLLSSFSGVRATAMNERSENSGADVYVNQDHGAGNGRRDRKCDKIPVGFGLSAAGRECAHPITSLQQQRENQRTAALFADAVEKSGCKPLDGGDRKISSGPTQRHVHVAYEKRKRVGGMQSQSEIDTEFDESFYDNVPRAVITASQQPGNGKRSATITNSLLFRRGRQPISSAPDSPIDYLLTSGNMQRDISVASGLLADSESSPLCGERAFALFDGVRSDVTTPDSAKSLSNSDGGGGATTCTQAAPEFQYKSARDYMMDREEQIPRSRPSHRCSTTTRVAETAAMGFVPKESVLRGETARFSTNTMSATTLSGESAAGHGASVEKGSKSSLTIPLEPRPTLANSLPALDRLDCHGYANVGRMDSATVGAMATEIGAANSTDLEMAESSNVVFPSQLDHAEIQARQCCFWLRAAGFPQYAKMYEDGQFPIDVDAAQKDHEFLDHDSLQALFRRLRSLNQCALIKLGCGQIQKRFPASTAKADSDEEDEIALSRKWRFVRKSRTWSRIVNEFGTPTSAAQYHQLTPTDSSSPPSQMIDSSQPGPSHLEEECNDLIANDMSQLAEQANAVPETEPPSMIFVKLRTSSFRHNDEPADSRKQDQQQPQQRLRRSQSERLRDKAKALVRRVDMLTNGRLRKRSPSLKRSIAEPEISGPVLIQHFSASPAHMRMFQESSLTSSASSGPSAAQPGSSRSVATLPVEQPVSLGNTKIDGDERRRGRVFLNDAEEKNRTNAISLGNLKGRLNDSMLEQRQCARNLEDPRPYNSHLALGNDPSSSRQIHQRQQFGPWHQVSGKRQCTDSESSPEAQPKGACSSLRVQVDVESRANTLPPVSQSSFESSDADHSPQCWERRDSGVGSSLSRSPSVPTRPRVRWHSFQRRHGAPPATMPLENAPTSIDHLMAPQVVAVQKYALLKLTALMERYYPSHKSSGWSWGVQKLLRRMKASESKLDKDRQVFGVPLHVIAQRTGQSLPQCILHAMRYLRKQAVDNVGLFRKSGVRSRIQKLRQLCETSTELPVFESQQAFDVADMVKQYFRELPEPLLTSKLSETFIAIYLNVPEHLRMEAMQKLILLLPDENREVLHSLLYFLHDVAAHAARNQMSAPNLAVCFAPTLFQLSSRNVALSPTRRHKTITTTSGLPSEKELMENRAAQICLATMITNCNKLFLVPQDILMKCAHTVGDLHEPSNLSELGHPYGNYNTYLAGCAEALIKEHRERWRGWVTEGCIDGVEITSKKANDEYPLKLWRCWVDVEAPPRELLHRILRERDVWDDDIIKWRVVRKLSDNCEVFQFVVNDMPPHPTRDYCLVRLWQSDVHDLRGGCVLVQTSINTPEAPMLGGVRGVCLASRYLIEPSGGGKSRITQVDRIDTRGRSKAWYNKVFGYLIATQLARLRDSFKQLADGPETKV